jgi:integrase
VLAPDELARLYAAADPHCRTFIALACATLSRPEAILELRMGQVDVASRLIDLNPAGREQTKKYRSVVPLTDTARWA